MFPAAATEPSTTLTRGAEVPWKLRVEEPINRFVYYPIARQIVRVLRKTPVRPNQITIIQPLIAACAAYLLTFNDTRHLIAAACVFELRSLLDCVDGTLARAKNVASAHGHALDAICDWLSVMALYAGILMHFHYHPPAAGLWSAYLPMGGVVALALFQGAARSFGADYYMRKYGSILEKGRDETIEDLRDLQVSLAASSPFFKKVEAWIGRCQYMCFHHEYFDIERSKSLSGAAAQHLVEQRNAQPTKLIARLWSLSNGDAFIRISVISLLFGSTLMWDLQLFWASAGYLWILAIFWLNKRFVRRAMAVELTEA